MPPTETIEAPLDQAVGVLVHGEYTALNKPSMFVALAQGEPVP